MSSDGRYPCADCGDRVLGCHATCERYLAARAAAEARREAERQNTRGSVAAKDLLSDGIVKKAKRRR